MLIQLSINEALRYVGLNFGSNHDRIGALGRAARGFNSSLVSSIRNRLAVLLLYEIYGRHYLAVQSMCVIGIIRRIDEAAEVTSMATADCATAFT